MRNVELVTVKEFFAEHSELQGYGMLTRNVSDIKHCNAGMFGDGVLGTLLVPDRNDLSSAALKCGFYLDCERLMIIDDDGDAEEMLGHMVKTEHFEDSDPAFVLFEIIDFLVRDDLVFLEEYERKLDDIEDMVTDDDAEIPEDLNGFVSQYRKDLRELTGYYKLLADAMDVVEAFLAKIGDERNQQFFAFLGNKVDRLYHEATGIAEYVLQIRDIHQSKISSQQNKVMQLLTIVTTIFMPLTLITGWYGMNFREMPELYFKYGYAAVIVISAVTVVIEIIFFKKKKWF